MDVILGLISAVSLNSANRQFSPTGPVQNRGFHVTSKMDGARFNRFREANGLGEERVSGVYLVYGF
jgi:hypothetical protein